MAQLFSSNTFSANAFSLNVSSTFTAIYSQSIVNTNNFFTYFYQRKHYLENYIRFIRMKPINSLRVIGLEVLGQIVLVLNNCAARRFHPHSPLQSLSRLTLLSDKLLMFTEINFVLKKSFYNYESIITIDILQHLMRLCEVLGGGVKSTEYA